LLPGQYGFVKVRLLVFVLFYDSVILMQTPLINDTDILKICEWGLCDYQLVWDKMRDYTVERTDSSPDQIWYLQHNPVYTLGLNGKQKHILNQNNIPLIAVDRGGQVTYHGPGQLIVYLLIDLNRKQIGIKQIVHAMEQAVIDYLKALDIIAERKVGAPGIYVNGAKIAALGLRIKKGCSYHGLALNVDMDLSPFSDINPCGYTDLPVTQIKDLLDPENTHETPGIMDVKNKLHPHLCRYLSYNTHNT